MQHAPPIPTINITPGRLVFYAQPQDINRSVMPKITGSEVRQRNNNVMSNEQKKRLKQAINTLAYIAKYKTVYQKATNKSFRFKLAFITLTLPSKQAHSDRFIVESIFSKFLESWKKLNPSLLYVWKAEVQDNGNLHFHITTNVFIHYMKLRERWNRALSKHGYITKNRISEVNSTDVHCIVNIKNIAAYLTSYIAKKDLYKKPLKRYLSRFADVLSDQSQPVFSLPKNYFKQLKRKVECSIYSCSKPLLNAKVNVMAEDKGILQDLEYLDKKATKELRLDYCSLLYFKPDQLKNTITMRKLYDSMINERMKNYSSNDKMYYSI